MANGQFRITGMEGSQDAEQVQRALKSVFGIQEVEMHRQSGNVTFTYDERSASLLDFKQAVLEAGYTISGDGEVSRNSEGAN